MRRVHCKDMSRRKKRFWAGEEKREICAQATTLGMSVAQVARRYSVNANLVFKWLKDSRFAPEAQGHVPHRIVRHQNYPVSRLKTCPFTLCVPKSAADDKERSV